MLQLAAWRQLKIQSHHPFLQQLTSPDQVRAPDPQAVPLLPAKAAQPQQVLSLLRCLSAPAVAAVRLLPRIASAVEYAPEEREPSCRGYQST